MTRDEFVDELIGCAKEIWRKYWRALPDEQRLRLAGREEELRGITRGVLSGLWALVAEATEGNAFNHRPRGPLYLGA